MDTKIPMKTPPKSLFNYLKGGVGNDPPSSISIDLETYSSIDIGDCGVYRYVESPDFEILLFGYAFDDEEAQVIDLTEMLPEEIDEFKEELHALFASGIKVRAYNANFEHTCLSHWLGYNIPLDNWWDTMITAAVCGLPRSLKDVGKVLGMSEEDAKMREGTLLVRYFCMPCKPTKANGGRTRNRRSDAPEKWQKFVEYNRQDVVAERAIWRKIKRLEPSKDEHDVWMLDQSINDRGVRCDRVLAENAVMISERYTADLMSTLKRITRLDNPNSVMQLGSWLEMEKLDKESVAEELKTAVGNRKRVLELRQEIGKSSVKKYEAMMNYMCRDDRCRGLFQFYGANRTGRWCLTGDHEILTPTGWIRLDQWTGGPIACWTPQTEGVSFQNAEALSFPYSGPMYTYKDVRIDQCSTPDHRMYAKPRYDKDWEVMTIKEMSEKRACIPMTGYKYHRGCANPAWVRVLIMTQADGTYKLDGQVSFHFKKERKIERCKTLLRKAEILFTERKCSDGSTLINIPSRAVPLWLREFKSKVFGYWLFDENPDIFFDELPNWDGYYPAPNSIQYSTTIKQNADIVQALAHMSGRTAIIKIKEHSKKNPNWTDAYVVDIGLNLKNVHEIKGKPEISEFEGIVYCASTQTGFFLVRRNGRAWITGNSGRGIQLQNLPQNHLSDLDVARKVVRAGDYDGFETLYDVPATLSELIRTAFVPKEGHVFAVADFSAIEARIVAWLANEKWRMDLFAKGGDIYCQSASEMFKCPVEKGGINGHLRQKGKI